MAMAELCEFASIGTAYVLYDQPHGPIAITVVCAMCEQRFQAMKGCQPVRNSPEVGVSSFTIMESTQSLSSVLNRSALAQDQAHI